MNNKYSLKRNEDIAKLVHLRKSVGNKYYAIYHHKNDNEIPKIAISISKKFGNAVCRNYEKRVIREIIRPLLGELNFLELLIVIKKEASKLTFKEKEAQVHYLLRKIKRQ